MRAEELISNGTLRANARLWEAQGRRCPGCGGKIGDVRPGAAMAPTEDHVVPRSKGGSGERPNIVLMHAACNRRKGNRQPHPCELLFAEVAWEIFIWRAQQDARRKTYDRYAACV